jgi:tRNA nucleotidyltransferase/poly(A) polymerase
MIIKKYKLFLETFKIENMWNVIPQSVKDIHKLFSENGKKLYLVGGSVRDFINNEKPKDFDLATDATPDEVLSMLKNKYKVKLQGEAFGVVVAYTEDQPDGIEIATFREDIYGELLGKTRNPTVKFTTIDKDVQRRDITFNGLFFDLDKREIIDLVGGVDDIKNKIVRMIGDASLRIKEDPLRILRLFRIATRYRFQIDEKTKDAIHENHDLSTISRERIWDNSGIGEINKAWKQSKDFSEYLNYFTEFDMWDDIFPGSIINKNIGISPYLEVYIANLFVNENTQTLLNKLVQKYKIEVDFARKVVFLIDLINLKSIIDREEILIIYKKKEISRVNDDVIKNWYQLNNLNDLIYSKFLDFKPSVSAEELMQKGYKGKDLGDEIKKLETQKFKNDL